jgi:hypothetical protein
MLEDPRVYDERVGAISYPKKWFFDSIGVVNGSIGTNVARLWKNEVSGFLWRAGNPTPRDWVPVVGISQALWYTFLWFDMQKNTRLPYEKIRALDHSVVLSETLIIHSSLVDEFLQFTKGITDE